MGLASNSDRPGRHGGYRASATMCSTLTSWMTIWEAFVHLRIDKNRGRFLSPAIQLDTSIANWHSFSQLSAFCKL